MMTELTNDTYRQESGMTHQRKHQRQHNRYVGGRVVHYRILGGSGHKPLDKAHTNAVNDLLVFPIEYIHAVLEVELKALRVI